MKGIVTVPAAASPQPIVFFSHHRYDSRFIPCQSQISVLLKTRQHRPTSFVSLSSLSSTTSSSSIVEQQQEEQQDSVDNNGDDALPFSGCKACGRDQIERGCNGEGRIQGGIATIPGFGWWPIKAYRPCPGFVASGGNYRRRGQSLDEVAFGGGKRGSSMDGSDETRKKGTDRRRFKS